MQLSASMRDFGRPAALRNISSMFRIGSDDQDAGQTGIGRTNRSKGR